MVKANRENGQTEKSRRDDMIIEKNCIFTF